MIDRYASINYEESDRFGLHFRFDGKENPEFQTKIAGFLKSQAERFPFLSQMELHINSRNTFPHSSGIASSASSMSALVLCLLDIESKLKGDPIDLKEASRIARLASGSACRSVFPKAALWGATEAFEGSSDEYAMSLEDHVAPVFKTYHDSILIVSDAKKSVSSRAGHALMDTNPYAATRYAVANRNIVDLLVALKTGDLEAFMRITEWEAMQLHALMMCSNPSFILMKPNTLRIINTLYEFDETQHLAYHQYTLRISPRDRHPRVFHPRCWTQCASALSRPTCRDGGAFHHGRAGAVLP